MKISKKRLKSLIENYLLEQEEGLDSKKDSKDKKEIKVKPTTMEVGKNHGDISINKKTGEVTLKVTGGEQESIVSLKPEDVEGDSQEKADFVEVASGYIQDLRRTSEKKAKEFLDTLKPLIDLTDAIDYKPALVKFDKKYNINDVDSKNNSKLA